VYGGDLMAQFLVEERHLRKKFDKGQLATFNDSPRTHSRKKGPGYCRYRFSA